MENNKHTNRAVTVEPHEPLLSRPPDDQLLYKVIRVEDLIRSISGSYLHFNRVDSYKDFVGADAQDGEQLPQDLDINQNTKFIKAPDFSLADYYSQFRARTYACCFSIENLDHIWVNFGNGGEKGKVCLVISFGKLREMLNDAILKGTWMLDSGIRLRPIFNINYGLIDYIDWKDHRSNAELFQNPLKYIYFKDKKRFQTEKELRISLSTEGLRKITLNDGSVMEFPTHLQMAFHFGTAIENGTIGEILHSPDCDSEYLYSELLRFGIGRKNIKGSYRDREEPRSAPLPHRRAYGSVHGGSAGQANDSQGNESSSLVPESIP